MIGQGVVPELNATRLRASIDAMAEVGGLPAGGSCRLALSDEDRAARDLFSTWCREAGCSVDVDAFGNIFATRKGLTPDAAPVLFGSHLDTQPHGGRFDGIYGVLAGLEVLRTLEDRDVRTSRPLMLVNWSNEEGVRFAPGLTGSKGFASQLGTGELAGLMTEDGRSFADELVRIGYAGGYVAPKPSAYVELHIEQGPILEREDCPIGVVTGVQGVRWFRVHVTGADRHAGTTPMDMRADSFMATARIALALRRAALDASADVRLTIGRVAVDPGSVNTVPGGATFTVDLRHPDTGILDHVEDRLGAIATAEALLEGCSADVERIFDLPPIEFSETVVSIVAAAADAGGFASRRIVSGAMHDACPLSAVTDTAMIFVPCREGVSHNEAEDVEPRHLAAGANTLLATVLELAER